MTVWDSTERARAFPGNLFGDSVRRHGEGNLDSPDRKKLKI